MNWAHLQSFVAVAEQGSLSGAARQLSSSQPTLSRHIAQLESDLGTRLFERSSGGVVLTPEGSDLMAQASTMADAAARLDTLRDGRAPHMSGTVRITASQIVATYHLPQILTRFHQRYPEVSIELIASDHTENLLRREADIAVRMYRPTQNDVITQHIGALDIGVYATPEYLAQNGTPTGIEDLKEHHIIGYDRSSLIIDGMRAMGLEVSRDFFKFRSDDQVVCWQMVRAGFGIGFNHANIGDADPILVRIAANQMVGQMPVWLTAHPELRNTPRIRRVFDFMRDALSEITTRR